jgi:hypothetical protein
MLTDPPLPAVLLSAAVLLIGGVVGVAAWTVRTMASRLITELDRRLQYIDHVAEEVQRVDADLKRLMIELPIHYQRREDAVRDTTTLMARVDAVGARIDHFVRREDHVRTETILNAKLDALAVALTKLTEVKTS